MAAQQGWLVQQLKIDDGCYEVRGTDSQGRRFKAKIDPETLQVVKMKQHDRPHKREREHGRDSEHTAPQGEPQQPGSAIAPSPVFAPGTAPRGQID